jgi:uncharacterized secreted protein with C-terminal beta-propeller domain
MRHIGLIILAFLAVACGSSKDPEDVVVANASLTAVTGCEGLEKAIEERATREMNADIDVLIDRIRNGGGEINFASDSFTPTAAPTPTPAPTRDSASDFTTTNNQEKGVDEPDIVKNDGSRIFVVHGRKVLALGAWPPDNGRIEWELTVEGYPSSLLLYQNRLVVFSTVSLPQLGTPQGPYPLDASSLYPYGNAVKVTVLDVAGESPSTLLEQYYEGSFLSARRNDQSVRAVSLAGRRGPELVYWPEGNVKWSDEEAATSAMEKLRKENTTRIRASRLEDWLPRTFTKGAGGALVPVTQACSAFAVPNVPSRLAFTTVSTLDLSRLETRQNTLVSEASEVYASTEALYLTARHDWTNHPPKTSVREDHTYVFEFDITSDGSQTIPRAAGGVPGHILDQFSLDEEAGALRVATTRQTWLGWELMSSTSGVYVLRRSGSRLEKVGEVTGLAKNERLYAARFEGTRGYLVTFRNVDPLFTVDLTNPSSPRVAGELKVPGYSTYIHLMDPTHLLTIGREVSEDGRIMGGVQLQIFDVTNFASPTLLHRTSLGSRYSSSEAEYDHKAFNYFASRGLLALPYSDWTGARRYGFLSGMELFRVDATSGFQSLGAVDHSDLYAFETGGGYGWTPSIRRSVMMETYVWSLSSAGAKLHDTRDLRRPVRVLTFPEME